MKSALALCLSALLLAGACTTTGGGEDRGRHRTGPPAPPYHYGHRHDRLRNRMVFAAGVMRACGRHNDARRATWNATVANKRPKRSGRWSGRRMGKALRRSTDAAVRSRARGRLSCRSFEVARMAHRIGKAHSRLRHTYPHARPPKRKAARPGSRDRDALRRRGKRES